MEASRNAVQTGLLRRLFRLWGLYARMDILWVTRDLKLFMMWYFSDGIFMVAAVTGMLLLAERFAGIGIWNKYQVIFMLGYATTVSGLVEMFFGYNVSFISRRLGRGQLDHTLIQPQPIWMTLLTEGFAPFSGSASLLPGAAMMLWAERRLALQTGPGWVAAVLLSLLASAAILLAFQYLWGSLAFWAPRSAEEINSSTMRLMNQLKSFPLDGLGAGLSGGLLTVLPVGFIAWYPCRALLGVESTPSGLWRMPLAAVLFWLLAAGAFRRGLRHYGRTGSQRYSGFGHRN
jgi:ABC-2 type transport system permease protein